MLLGFFYHLILLVIILAFFPQCVLKEATLRPYPSLTPTTNNDIITDPLNGSGSDS